MFKLKQYSIHSYHYPTRHIQAGVTSAGPGITLVNTEKCFNPVPTKDSDLKITKLNFREEDRSTGLDIR